MAISSVWSQGYVTDTLYTDNIFREQAPSWINYVAALNGCVPRPLDRPFSYLELGCGMGHSITIFAAANPEARFVGVDFNPAHIDHAQRRARALGLSNLTFVEASFEDLAADPAGQGIARPLGLVTGSGAAGQYDFITFHGIYSWIRPAARAAMQRICFDRLLPGGFVYNSYNCLPGWAAEVPVQRLVSEFARVGSGDSTARASFAFSRIDEMAKIKSGFFAALPNLARQIGNLQKKPGNYLAHEYLNGDWNAFYATDVAEEMARAKLDYVGAATLAENHADLVLTEEARKAVAAQADPALRVLMRDFLVNQRFRRDVFVRGHARLGTRAQQRAKADLPLAAAKPLGDLKPSFKVPRGTVTFDIPNFDKLVALIGQGAASERELAAAFVGQGGKVQDFGRLLNILVATGTLSPAARSHQPAPLTRQKNGATPRQRLTLKSNAAEFQAAQENGTGAAFASPVSGNVVQLAASDLLALQECLTGSQTAAALAEKMQVAMGKRGMRILHEGKVVSEPAAQKARLEAQATTFLDQTLPFLRATGVLETA
ncbi:methyltransferase family protein [Dongia mobilis]|uniref:Methyltransferase family protein n=1 Tax=Dongia mobilis TaxID=578943 RepID=A0A4R6WKU7_9PROT|nr:class I SAM-dependent methyltransferase [Dongia mobilis]TDQ81312.1 methyltransferase family protein [Dongia mobilis]